MTEQPGTEIPCLLVCRDCGDDLVLPFPSYRERGRWATGHTAGTGHARWLCLDIPIATPDAAPAEPPNAQPPLAHPQETRR